MGSWEGLAGWGISESMGGVEYGRTGEALQSWEHTYCSAVMQRGGLQ